VGADKNGMGGKMIYGPADIEGDFRRQIERRYRREQIEKRRERAGEREEFNYIV
jgi:hypothetical protein